MTPTERTTDEPLERRVAQALGARAALKTVEPAALGERLARVHAAAGDGAGATGPAAPAPVVELVGAQDDDAAPKRWRSRLVVAAVASAAAAAVIAAAVLSAVHDGSGAPAPAATSQPSPSSSYPGEEWSGFYGLAHAQWPSDLEGVAQLGDEVVAGSVRMITQLGEVKYWAGFTSDGGVCWKVVGPGADEGACAPEAALAKPVEVSDGSVAPRVWLVPAGAPDAETEPLTAEGVVPYVHGVWVEARAATPPVDRYAQLRAAPTAADERAAGFEYAGINAIVPGSLRLLHEGEEGTYVVGALPLGKFCFFDFVPGVAGSTCQSPQQLAGEGTMVSIEDQESNDLATAWLVPDDLDTSGWPALGRRQLAENLWYQREPIPPHTPEPVRSLTPEEEQALREQTKVAAQQAATGGFIAPDVVGLTQAEATWVLDRYHIPVSEVTVRDAGSAPSGMVVKATPGTDEQAPEGTGVHLFVFVAK
ncbi:PASTA domain-containing protein [Quadrisphaera setariae]|uniref:PASTA domain-containing protein n=1 Tax=Quadrisphaera setariae TaxID=2593304 RepID=A0A5C8ZIU0_9ACTN|nr:PASTA domain-containing protein [Quadrisphaera setariae]TXR56790.1 hypothetical protein FMM08_08655 [Quadrisphaera setariae]